MITRIYTSRFLIIMFVVLLNLPNMSKANSINNCPSTVIDGYVKLQKNCIYNGTFTLNKSNTGLDCQGAVIDGANNKKFGVVILGSGKPLSNITVKNCIVKNFINSGIRIASGIPVRNLGNNPKELNYENSPKYITLDNVEVINSGKVGIFIDSYSSYITIKNSKISNSQMVGIYLEHSSRYNKILNNVIQKNGYNHGAVNQREGIAIDSSADNLISGNTFIDNFAGGVFLYKNCGEKSHTKNAITRWQHSDNNIIKNNDFLREHIGIWIASRQSKDLSRLDCGDPALDSEKKYFKDYADNNIVDSNTFCNGHVAIIIEGDNNIIINNRVDGDIKNNILIPSTKDKELTGKVIFNNIKKNNTNFECKS